MRNLNLKTSVLDGGRRRTLNDPRSHRLAEPSPYKHVANGSKFVSEAIETLNTTRGNLSRAPSKKACESDVSGAENPSTLLSSRPFAQAILARD